MIGPFHSLANSQSTQYDQSNLDVAVTTLMTIDSLDLSDAGRAKILAR